MEYLISYLILAVLGGVSWWLGGKININFDRLEQFIFGKGEE